MLFLLNGKKRNIYYLPDNYLRWIIDLNVSNKAVQIARGVLMKRNKLREQILHKIQNEGVDYWLTNYFDFKEVEKAFSREIAEKCSKASTLLSEVEDWYAKAYEEYVESE